MIGVQIDQNSLDSLYRTLAGITNGANTALSRAVNKGLTGVSPELKSVIQETHNIKSTVITKQIVVEKTTPTKLQGKATVGKRKGGGGVYGRGKGTPLISFRGGRTSKKKGYSVKLKANKGKVSFQNAFVATMKSGHKGVFVRAGYTNLAKNNATGSSRLSTSQGKRIATSTLVAKVKQKRKEAITEMFSTSAVDAARNLEFNNRFYTRVGGRITTELLRQVDMLIGRL